MSHLGSVDGSIREILDGGVNAEFDQSLGGTGAFIPRAVRDGNAVPIHIAHSTVSY